MENLNEQELRLELVKESNYDLAKAEELYNFIVGNQPKEIDKPVADEHKPDGIYYILSPTKAIHNDTATSDDIRNCVAVGVKMGDRFANVLLHDAADGKCVALWHKDFDTSNHEHYYDKSKYDAMSDWDGEGNTDKMRSELNPKINLRENEYIPSLAQLYLILLNINAINRALEEAHGQPIKAKCIWSSSELDDEHCWSVNFLSVITTFFHKANKRILRPSLHVEL